MKFEDCVKNISTNIELKRIASAYVVDCKNLGREELIQSLNKTAGQYYDKSNVAASVKRLALSEKKDERVLADIILKEILLNKDDYGKEQKLLDEEVVTYEQNIINISNELDTKNMDDNMRFLKFIIEVAYENDNISPDEKNLLEKIRIRLNILQEEFRILEAQVGKFPKANNEVHLRNEIDAVRKSLQQSGLVFSIRNSEGDDLDIIPDEIAVALKEFYEKEMRNYGYQQLIQSKYLRDKIFLIGGVDKAGMHLKLDQLRKLVFERIKPSNLLGGYSPKDGLSKDALMQWCLDLKIPSAGTKEELIQRIITYYDEIKEIKIDSTDKREVLFSVYEYLARRDLKHLRQQGLIIKDLECEHKFEEATNYMFEKLFRQKPLLLTGSDHPDGILSYQNKLIMWDNKSKETPVRLRDHLSQFERYIRNSDKPVSVFIVIASEFTDDSVTECTKYALNSDTFMLLLRAEDVKELAIKWSNLHKNDEESFNLGYFKQNGKFIKEYVPF